MNFPDSDKATIEKDYEYQHCCKDNKGEISENRKRVIFSTNMLFCFCSLGLWPLKAVKLEPRTCSQRICFYSKSLPHSIWKSEQVYEI